MKKSTVAILITILIIIFGTSFFAYYKTVKNKEKEQTIKNNEKIQELNSKISELENKTNKEEISTIANRIDSYIPDGIKVANKVDIENTTNKNDIEIYRDPNLVTLEIDKDTLSKIGVTLIITDNNENSYGWGHGYQVQKKINNNWADLESKEEMIFTALGYSLDENNQWEYKIDWSRYYGKLENGIYRIKKKIYDNNNYIDLYSNEFEIK